MDPHKLRQIILTLFFWQILQISVVVSAAPSPGAINISVRFDHTFYELKSMQGQFSYKESGRTYVVKVKDCNKASLDKIAETYRALLKRYSAKPALPKTQYDVELMNSGTKIFVARGSDFGTWLREMPKKAMYVTAEAQASCKK